MANKVTGTTDTSGALSVSPADANAVLLVGVTSVASPTFDTITTIGGTADAIALFGSSSPFVEAVKVLITNGVTNIVGVVVDPTVVAPATIADKYEKAMDATLDYASIKCVLIDSFDATHIQALNAHLITAEAADKFRYSVVAPNPATTTSQSAIIAFAATVDSDRIFIPGPTCTTDGTTATPAVTVAAGLMAVIVTETSDPALPVNGVTISGIGSVSRPVLETEKALLVAGGVTPLYNYNGDVVIYRLVTSSNDEVWHDGTTRFIADYVLNSNEELLRANYKRTKNVARILESIKTDLKVNMEAIEKLEIIENFDPTTLTVIKDPADLYGALVDYQFDVVTPLYTITITQHMKL